MRIVKLQSFAGIECRQAALREGERAPGQERGTTGGSDIAAASLCFRAIASFSPTAEGLAHPCTVTSSTQVSGNDLIPRACGLPRPTWTALGFFCWDIEQARPGGGCCSTVSKAACLIVQICTLGVVAFAQAQASRLLEASLEWSALGLHAAVWQVSLVPL